MSLSVKQCGMESIRSIVTASASASECSEKFNCCCVRAIEMRASMAVAGAVGGGHSKLPAHPQIIRDAETGSLRLIDSAKREN